jgi:hypothetical protein
MGDWPPLSTPILGLLFEYASTLGLYPKLLFSTLYKDVLKMGDWPPLSMPILGLLF